MLLLALDTSTRSASVALCSENELLSEYTWYAENNHSVDLLDRIQRITVERQISLQQLDAVAVTTGPGSFNALRVALTAAKSLAFAIEKPLFGVTTLDLIAAEQQQWNGVICSVLEAGRSELYAAFYRCIPVRQSSIVSYELRQLSDYMLCPPAQLASYLNKHRQTWNVDRFNPVLFCGEMKSLSWQALQQGITVSPVDKASGMELALLRDGLASTRHAATLAQLAFQRLQHGKADDPLLLEPLYLRRPSITKSTRKQALFASDSQRPTGHDDMTEEREQGALRR
ncbi:tRNA (adenosine(37)-N6)-threonylcarbamoyltransferase complex dimerization subunit type 1 TsaB [Dictyobacter arantiisoli]|uniref:tRNA (Adenosine(37)-N6)-threonylcarbamoyltransferase complex dimerization subunit type 1 TsaB n=1 Tax=Dictyobacter arantiisoli TaxID=2014874 RepID=A0A5A5TJU8_9CHLR|nr:tRNA (adenosine(37)-N6)-threonylcarbamoyltransferase complex dimerization subunit type 1 TsaB [Dictyobacter arantiisoli]GCF11303.1 tRNA (adenosine(37)-N6)-threonylcarbamoyltransferase complex dimerization subunit type 1 TsaB [Dictyobacter arantiisoli]